MVLHSPYPLSEQITPYGAAIFPDVTHLTAVAALLGCLSLGPNESSEHLVFSSQALVLSWGFWFRSCCYQDTPCCLSIWPLTSVGVHISSQREPSHWAASLPSLCPISGPEGSWSMVEGTALGLWAMSISCFVPFVPRGLFLPMDP